MTIPPGAPAKPRPFSARWHAASAAADLASWCEFLAEHGVTWSPDARDRDFVDQLSRSDLPEAADGIEVRLAKRAGDALPRTNDPRRVLRQVSSERPRRWYLLSPEEQRALEQRGMRFDRGMMNPALQVGLLLVMFGVFIAAGYGYAFAGLSPILAWLISIVAYALTTRVTRGRWPLHGRS